MQRHSAMTATALLAMSLSGISLSSVVPAANHSSDDVLMSEHTHDGAGQRGRGCNAVSAGHLNTGDYAHHQVVCACSEAMGCDTIEPEGPIGASSVVLYESHASEGGNPARHMARFEHVISSRPFEIFERELLVGCERRQTMRGFGGAFTDSSAAHFTAMPPAVKEHFLESYFGGGADATTGAPAARDGGIGYSLGRVVLGSADFSTGVWSYDDVEGDLNLTHFSLQRDEASGKLPMIRAALAKRAQPTAGAGAGARAGGGQSSAGDHGGSAAGGWRESAGGKGSGGGQRQGHAAAGVAGTALKPALSLYGSAWAPPAWMTTTNATLHCTMKDGYAPGAPHATAFARYLRLALDGYANAGAPLFGVTAGNEPNRLGQSWQQLVMSAADQREWIAHHLGPALKPKLARQLAQRNASVLPAAASPPPHVAAAADAAGASAANHRAGAAAASSETWPDTEYELMMLDDQRTYIHSWAQAVLGAETSAHRPRARARSAGSGDVAAAAPPPPADAASYVDGIGFHWYMALEDTLIVHPGRMLAAAHAKFPSKYLLATEACEGYLPAHKGPQPGSWWRALTYAYDIIEDTSNWAVGWTDWNLVLNLQGGPNWRGNFVDAPILWHGAEQTFYKQPLFYAMGHFSKFVPPGSVNLGLRSTGRLELPAVAFLRPDNVVVIVAINQRSVRRHYMVTVQDGRHINMFIPPHAIQTVLYRLPDGACPAPVAEH